MSEVHPATHMADILSGHRSRIGDHYGRTYQHGERTDRRRVYRYVIQAAQEAFGATHHQVWGKAYDGHDDRKEEARFIAACLDEVIATTERLAP